MKINKLVYIKGDPFGIAGGNKLFILLPYYISAIPFRNFNQKASGKGSFLFSPDFEVLQPAIKRFTVGKDRYPDPKDVIFGF